jgi:hypothetical protein
MGIAPTTGFDRRDNRPGYASDVYLGYEQTVPQFRYGPEKFAATNISRDNVTSLGAETYYFTVGGSSTSVNGSGNGSAISNSTATWVYHDPAATNTVSGSGTATQRVPLNPASGQSVDVWVKVGYQFQINRCYIYYTTDGNNPEGSFAVGRGTTKVIQAFFAGHDSADATIDWWKGTLPASIQTSGVQVRYKVSLFKDAVGTMSDADLGKVYGLNQAAITNFNPTTVVAWLHNDLNTNNTAIGLSEGFHIIRARTFLPRVGKSASYNTFIQTFYYDAQPPGGVIATPSADGATISNLTYTVVVRADSSVTGVEFNIADSDSSNDDALTGLNNGNGLTNGTAKFAAATLATPDSTLTQQYLNYPQEFHFNYSAVPSNGTATITVRLKEFSTTVIPSRMTALTRTINTVAPSQTLNIVSPATDGSILVLATNSPLNIQACFTSTLTTNTYALFSIYINGVFQPRNATNGTPLYVLSPTGCTGSQRSLSYNWANPLPGTNVIQVIYTNQFYLSDIRAIAVVRPGDSDEDGISDYDELIAGTDPFDPNSVLRITSLDNGNQLVVWNSVSNVNYQVLATTNLNFPMLPISPLIPGNGSSAFFFDPTTDPTNKFYRIQVVP